MSVLAYRLRAFTVVVAALAGGLAKAQNLDQGKSGAQLFATDCMDCHHSPKGLARDSFSWTLSSFLQQHYTASPASVQALTAYLQSVDPHRSNQSPAVHSHQAAENSARASAPAPQAPAQPAAGKSRAQKYSESASPPRPPEPVPVR